VPLLTHSLYLTVSFYQDVAALEQTKAVLLSFLDPEQTNNPGLDLQAEPQCNILIAQTAFFDNLFRPAKPIGPFSDSFISSNLYLVLDNILRRLHNPYTKKCPQGPPI